MCGGGSDVVYTQDYYQLGLNIVKTDILGDGRYIRSEYTDTLRTPNSVYWSKRAYVRPLTQDDVDESQVSNRHEKEVNKILERRRHYIQKEAEKLEKASRQDGNKCVIL